VPFKALPDASETGRSNGLGEGELLEKLDPTRLPRHVAVIMDGNGRWARERGLPVQEGHRAGKDALRRVLETFEELGIRYLTVYAFSTENWRRPPEEVNFLMRLLDRAIDEEFDKLHRRGVRIRTIGCRDEKLPSRLCAKIEQAAERTRDNDKLIVTVAINYGGRAEIVEAARALAREAAEGRLDPASIDEAAFRGRLFTNGTPDPDLIIRTGGELRVSNFLLWQLAYAEFWVTPTYWPDFTKADLLRAFLDYQLRDRRMGSRSNAHGS